MNKEEHKTFIDIAKYLKTISETLILIEKRGRKTK